MILAAYLAMYKLSFDMLGGVRAKMDGMEPWLVVPFKILATLVNIADALGLALITAVWFVMVWRSAVNTDWVGWTILARGFVVAVAIVLVLGTVILWKAKQGG